MTDLKRCLMIGLTGPALTSADIHRLEHDCVYGVILFARNYESPNQLRALCTQIKAVRPDGVIAVDQEGGRVQRFCDGFTALPSLATLGAQYDDNPNAGRIAARQAAETLSAELSACGVDLSFAPVVDLGMNQAVIGDRAFHQNPACVTALARAFIEGLHANGMPAVLKHFPGHGSVSGDTHTSCVVDHRPYAEIAKQDLTPFQVLAADAEGVMAAHVVYDAVDPNPASQSRFWLQTVLRERCQFKGVVYSDDMGMQAVKSSEPVAAVKQALDAGCDVVLLCNEFNVIDDVLNQAHRLARV